MSKIIYGSQEQYSRLRSFLRDYNPALLEHLYPVTGFSSSFRPLANFPPEARLWLLDHCKYPEIISKLHNHHVYLGGDPAAMCPGYGTEAS